MPTTTEAIFHEIAGEDGFADLSRLTDDYLAGLRDRVTRGELPAGFVTVDPTVALNVLNRAEITGRFVAYRRRLHGYDIRAFVPVPARPLVWALSQEAEGEALAHAQQRLVAGIETSLRLHGGALVAYGLRTWQEIEADAVQAVRRTCRELSPEPTPQPVAAPTPSAPAGGPRRLSPQPEPALR